MVGEKAREEGITVNLDDSGCFTVILHCAEAISLWGISNHRDFSHPRRASFPHAGGSAMSRPGNEILPKLVGAADQADLTSLETAVVRPKRTLTDRESIAASGVSLLLFRRTVEIRCIRRVRSTRCSLARLNVSGKRKVRLHSRYINEILDSPVAMESIVTEVSIPSQ